MHTKKENQVSASTLCALRAVAEENVTVLAAGADDINTLVQRLANYAVLIGGSVVTLMVVVIGIMVTFGSAGGEGSGGIRKHLGKYTGVILGAITIGGGAVIGGVLVNLGSNLASGS
jgi:hypothetical protein